MLNRGEITWAPFNSVINSSEVIREFEREQMYVKKPILTEERIAEIENYIVTSYQEKTEVNLKYYQNHEIVIISGIITKIDVFAKKLVINKEISIYFSNIINFY